jgi:hypothetical protein
MREVDSGQDLTFYDLVLSVVYCFYSYENRKPRGGMEDGTWNKAYCFVYITCTLGSVCEYFGDSQQAVRGIHICGGEWKVRGETMPARQTRRGGEGPRL